jgi:nicotinate-nucleotide pyrophosphorylase (carboxylating)
MTQIQSDQLKQFLKEALQEDVGSGDHTSQACIPENQRSKAQLLVKDPGVIAGVEVAATLFRLIDPDCTFQELKADGDPVSTGEVAFEIHANTRALLLGERVALNIMQRLSGIATQANHFKFEIEDLDVKILDTRKTTPLLRFLEKWAVRLGGCYNYRDGLYDWFMIKDNHIDACGGIAQAIERVEEYQKDKGMNLGITVEVRNLVELHKVLEVGKVTRIMLDNFELPLLKEAVDTVGGKFETEASGGITIYNVRETALTGVDYISVGALTHSATSLDMSLKIVK